MPLFFTGCNFKLSNYCPRYTSYNGVVYYIGRHDPGYTVPDNGTYNILTNETNTNYLRRLAPSSASNNNYDKAKYRWDGY